MQLQTMAWLQENCERSMPDLLLQVAEAQLQSHVYSSNVLHNKCADLELIHHLSL